MILRSIPPLLLTLWAVLSLGVCADEPLAEAVTVRVHDPDGKPIEGVHVAVWTRSMTTAKDTPVGITDADGTASVVVPGPLIQPVAYVITPGDTDAVPRGWIRTWSTHYIPAAVAVRLSDPSTSNVCEVVAHPTITLTCPARNAAGEPLRGTGNSVVGLMLSGDSVTADGVIAARGVRKGAAGALIIESGFTSLWLDLTESQTKQDGPGPAVPQCVDPSGPNLQATITNLHAAELPPFWSFLPEVNFIASDGSVCYSFGVKANGVVRGRWISEKVRAETTIQLPQGEYFVVPGARAGTSVPAQRVWKALRDKRADELKAAGLSTITVAPSKPGEPPQQFTVDAKVAMDTILEHVKLAD